MTQLDAARCQFEELVSLVRDIRGCIEREVVGYHLPVGRWAEDDSTPFVKTDEWHTMTLDRILALRIDRLAGAKFAGDEPVSDGPITDGDCPF